MTSIVSINLVTVLVVTYKLGFLGVYSYFTDYTYMHHAYIVQYVKEIFCHT